MDAAMTALMSDRLYGPRPSTPLNRPAGIRWTQPGASSAEMSIAWTAHGSASAACRATRVIGDGDERSMTACRWFDRHHDDRRMGDQAEGFPPRLLVEVSGRRRRIIAIIDPVDRKS